MKQTRFIGIDAGGTRTCAVLTDARGQVLKSTESTASNYLSVGIPAAVEAICAAVLALGDTDGAAALAIGSSALDECTRDEQYAAFCKALRGDAHLGRIPLHFVQSDAFMALYGLTGEKPGALLISGTGVMGLSRDAQGTLFTVSGYGDRLGDPGSGFAIGQSGIRKALDCADGKAEDAKALLARFLRFYSLKQARDFISVVYANDYDKSLLAAFSAEVGALAQAGDAAAQGILDSAADALFADAKALCAKVAQDSFPFGIYGSVLVRDAWVRTRFTEKMKQAFPRVAVQEPRIDAALAAAQYAIQRSKI